MRTRETSTFDILKTNLRGCLTFGQNSLSLAAVNWPHEWALSSPQTTSVTLSDSPSVWVKYKIQTHLCWSQVNRADGKTSQHMQKLDTTAAHKHNMDSFPETFSSVLKETWVIEKDSRHKTLINGYVCKDGCTLSDSAAIRELLLPSINIKTKSQQDQKTHDAHEVVLPPSGQCRQSTAFCILWPPQLTLHTLTCSCLMDSDFSEHFLSKRRRFSWHSKRLCSAALSKSG